jgi:hypothetical protein
VVIPDDTKAVWIRRLPWYDKPVRSTWDRTAQTFVVLADDGTSTNTLPILVPVVEVHTWKFQHLDDELAQFPPPE